MPSKAKTCLDFFVTEKQQHLFRCAGGTNLDA